MSNITALLTGVCMYPAVGYPALPLCANDVQAVKKALIAGLNVSESNIMVCGHHGTATTKDLITGLYSSISGTANEDTFTSFLVDALTSRFLIREGKKSLESINEAIFHFAKIWNAKHPSQTQTPIFRSNIGGTIFFDVEEYKPYRVANVYEETEAYIIYNVAPVHFSLYYDRKNLNTWITENRIYLMDSSIKRYETDLEALRTLEKIYR